MNRFQKIFALPLFILAVLGAAGCASRGGSSEAEHHDAVETESGNPEVVIRAQSVDDIMMGIRSFMEEHAAENWSYHSSYRDEEPCCFRFHSTGERISGDWMRYNRTTNITRGMARAMITIMSQGRSTGAFRLIYEILPEGSDYRLVVHTAFEQNIGHIERGEPYAAWQRTLENIKELVEG